VGQASRLPLLLAPEPTSGTNHNNSTSLLTGEPEADQAKEPGHVRCLPHSISTAEAAPRGLDCHCPFRRPGGARRHRLDPCFSCPSGAWARKRGSSASQPRSGASLTSVPKRSLGTRNRRTRNRRTRNRRTRKVRAPLAHSLTLKNLWRRAMNVRCLCCCNDILRNLLSTSRIQEYLNDQLRSALD
jgi:hypothetical protein